MHVSICAKSADATILESSNVMRRITT